MAQRLDFIRERLTVRMDALAGLLDDPRGHEAFLVRSLRQPTPLKQPIATPQHQLERRLTAGADEHLEQHVVVRIDDHRAQSA
jgi:hypothetical protein